MMNCQKVLIVIVLRCGCCCFMTGTHRCDVEYAGQPVPGSPFMVKSFDPGKVQVTGIGNGVVGKQSLFSGK